MVSKILTLSCLLGLILTVHSFDTGHVQIHGNSMHVPALNMTVPLRPDMVSFVNSGRFQKTIEGGEASCFQAAKDMAFTTLPLIGICMREMHLTMANFTNPKSVRQFLPCFGKCMGIQLNVLNSDGTPNLENAKELMSRMIPKRFMEVIWVIWDICEKDVMEIKGDGMDDTNCESYRAGIRCVILNGINYAAEALKLCPDVPESIKEFILAILKDKRFIKYMNKILY